MGIFDKKSKGKKEEFDSPVERIDLSSEVKSKPAGEAKAEAKPEARKADPTAKAAPDAAPTKEAKAPKPEDDGSSQAYGIEEAIALMRTLPAESVELVVRVVKQTLESTNIDIPTIIKDATAKQKRIDNRVAVLKDEIGDLEKEIAERTEEISTLQGDHEETSMVKERLELAEKLGKPAAAAGSSKPAAAAPRRSATLPPPKGGATPSAAAKK